MNQSSQQHKSARVRKDLPSLRLNVWRRWLVPRPFDSVSMMLYLSTLGVFVVRQIIALPRAPFPWLSAVVIMALLVGLVALERWEYSRYGLTPPTSIAVGLLVVRAGLIETITQFDSFNVSVFLYIILPFTATLAFGRGGGALTGALVWAVFAAKMVWYKPQWYLNDAAITNVIVFTITVMFVLVMAQLVMTERTSRTRSDQLLAKLQVAHTQLQTHAAHVEDLATSNERNRLAREIHDSLGHYLTVINIQLEKALTFWAIDSVVAQQAVRDSKHLADDALADVRRSVGMLRQGGERIDLHAALDTFAAQHRSDQLGITVTVQGSAERVSGSALLALYRGAQEGLTNVQRHARATMVDLTLDIAADEACLTVQDNGIGFDARVLGTLSPGRTGCYGLQGVHERLALVGGRVEVHTQVGHGTRLTLRVPTEQGGAEGIGVLAHGGART